MNDTLIFIASNRKGEGLFQELAKRFDASHFVFAGYGSLPRAHRLVVRLLQKSGLGLKNRPTLDLRLRLLIAERTRAAVQRIASETSAGRIYMFCWQCLFALTADWRKLGSVSALTDVAMGEDYFKHFRIRNPRARSLRRALRTTTVENCENLFTHSQWAAEANRSIYPAYAQKIIRVGWGSDMPPILREEALGPRDGLKVLCIGHDYVRKGIDFYDQVAGRLKERIPGLECLVAGHPGREFDVHRLRHLTALGSMDRAELSRILQQSSLFALFSRFEPAGHVTVEAMSYGVPVVCSNKGGIAEPVVDGSTGFVCRSFSVDDAVEKACSIIADPARLAGFRRRAYEHAHGCWQWSHVVDRIVSRL